MTYPCTSVSILIIGTVLQPFLLAGLYWFCCSTPVVKCLCSQPANFNSYRIKICESVKPIFPMVPCTAHKHTHILVAAIQEWGCFSALCSQHVESGQFYMIRPKKKRCKKFEHTFCEAQVYQCQIRHSNNSWKHRFSAVKKNTPQIGLLHFKLLQSFSISPLYCISAPVSLRGTLSHWLSFTLLNKLCCPFTYFPFPNVDS